MKWHVNNYTFITPDFLKRTWQRLHPFQPFEWERAKRKGFLCPMSLKGLRKGKIERARARRKKVGEEKTAISWLHSLTVFVLVNFCYATWEILCSSCKLKIFQFYTRLFWSIFSHFVAAQARSTLAASSQRKKQFYNSWNKTIPLKNPEKMGDVNDVRRLIIETISHFSDSRF